MARLFLINGRVLTRASGDQEAWGVEMEGGRIQRLLSSRQDVERRQGDRVVDLEGDVLMPSFGDAHMHLRSWAERDARLDLSRAGSLDEVLQLVEAEAAGLGDGEWLLGACWNRSRTAPDRWPDRQLLDRFTADRPALLSTHDLHGCWVNSRGLAELGLGGDLTNRLEGLPRGVMTLERGKSLVATGILREAAAFQVERQVPPPDRRRLARALRRKFRALYRLGITSVTDFDGLEALEDYVALEEPLRVLGSTLHEQLDDARRASLGRGSQLGERVRMGHLKLFLDGSLGSRSAWLQDCYEGSQEDRGMGIYSWEELRDVTARALEMQLDLALHAIGDRANRQALDLFESWRSKFPTARFRIEHAQLLREADLDRFDRLNVVASVQPAHLLDDVEGGDREWGTRCQLAFPLASLHRRGCRLAFGSDVPVGPVDPRQALSSALRRQNREGKPRGGWFPGEKLEAGAALEAVTEGAHGANGLEGDAGRLVPGWNGDLVALTGLPCSENPLDIRVRATWIAGEAVHGPRNWR